jgi:O-antigen ligase
MLIAYLLSSGEKSRISFMKSPETKCILGIFVLSIWSIPFSVWPGGSVQYVINHLIGNVVFFFVLTRTISGTGQLKKMIFVLLIATAILSAFSLSSRAEVSRISAGSYDPNDLAFLMVCALPFAVFGFFEEKGIKKLLLLLCMGLLTSTVIFTHSRGGFIGLIIVGGITLLKIFKRKKGAAVLFLGVFTLLFTLLNPAGYWERMATIAEPGDDYNVNSPAGRIKVWEKGVKFMIENPFTGIGVGNFTTAEGLSHRDIGGMWVTAHNSFVEIGAELGFGGLIAFLLFFYFALRGLKRIDIPDSKTRTIVESLRVSLWGYIIGGFFLSQAYAPIFYLLAGMVVCIRQVSKKEKDLG